jgi:hypothetical protein
MDGGVLVIAGIGKAADVALQSVAAGITYRFGVNLIADQLYQPVKGFGHGPTGEP